jgi:hypothetical protein
MSSTSGPNFITPGLSVNIVIVRRKSALLQRKGSSGRSRRRAPLAVGFWRYGNLWNISLPAGVIAGPRSNKRDKAMKMLVSGFALALALAFTGPAFAQDAAAATDKASCDKAGGTWDDAAKKCTPKQ